MPKDRERREGKGGGDADRMELPQSEQPVGAPSPEERDTPLQGKRERRG